MVASVEIQEVNVQTEAQMTTGTVTSLDFNDANPDTIVINGGGTWDATNIAGSIIRISSATVGANDGDWTISSVSGATATLVSGDALSVSSGDTTAVIAGEVAIDKTSGTIRFKNADNPTVDTNDPLVIPTSNTEYSYEKWLKLRITATAPDTEITNVEFYMDGAKGWQAGVKLWGDVSESAYVDPGIPTETNDPPQTPLNGTPVAATDAFTWTAGSPVTVGAGPFTTANTDIGNWVILVMEVETGSTQGTLTAETATFEYDEI